MKRKTMSRNRNIEILAPAGSIEVMTAAVRTGADAVYLGGARFSARAGAANFDNEQLKAAVEYCHARDVKVYLAVNTLLLENELPAALEFVRYACTLPVDALLIQDMGLARLLKSRAPELRLHASTQTSAHTAAAACALYSNGFSRVVLARELSLKEIADIHASCPIELETFVHGALCMSVSGQCYFSSVFGSRSGNRGRCAQPCRLPFAAPGGTGHDLSLKDLSMITRISEMQSAGAVSAKIEGRLKRPEYVAAAVRAARLSADGQPVPRELLENLKAVFSRSGFTSGYPDGKLGREMFGIRSKENVADATGAVLAGLRSLYSKELMKIPIDYILKIKYNKKTVLIAADCEGHTALAEGDIPAAAVNRAVDSAQCEKQLKKTGGTPFYADNIACEIDGGLSVPFSELNRLRREVLQKLEQARGKKPPVPFAVRENPQPEPHKAGKFRLRARFTGTDIPQAAKQCELIYLPYGTPNEKLKQLITGGFHAALEIPRGIFGMEAAVRRRLKDAKTVGVTDVWAGTLDGASIGVELGFAVHGGFSLNITNTEALEWYREFGLKDAELSFELTLAQAARIGGEFPRGLLLYGRLPLMLCRNCPVANSSRGCLHCRTAPVLTDRKGIKFPVQCGGACSEVLNSVPLYTADIIREVKNQDFGILRFTTESKAEAGAVLDEYFSAARGGSIPKPQNGFTRGLYHRQLVD